MKSTKLAPLGRVPETLLKKRKRNLEAETRRVQNLNKVRKERKQQRKVIFQRAEKYYREYRNEEKSKEFFRQQALKDGNFYVEPEAKLAFVIRIKGLKEMSPRVRKALQLLRLRQIHMGVFVRINQATINMLRIVEPYVTWGYPNLEQTKNLIYKRGFGKVNGQRAAISSNSVIETVLKKQDIICMEDLIHEIHTVGPHFKEANNFLWPFKLNTPKGGFNNVKIHFAEGGDCGNREEYINDLISKML